MKAEDGGAMRPENEGATVFVAHTEAAMIREMAGEGNGDESADTGNKSMVVFPSAKLIWSN